jgi:membrane protease YdiL (CAAX protease family)
VFRGLLMTFLMQRMPGRITLRGYSVSGAGVVVAAIYAASYALSFLNKPFLTAFGQILYAFVLGVVFAYWYERSKSLLAPIIGHNIASFIEQSLVFVMVAAWR